MRLPQDRILHIDTEFENGKLNVIVEWQGELVRCKDCRHAEHREQMPNQVYCKRDKLSTFCAVHDYDDFCKWGERREESEVEE